MPPASPELNVPAAADRSSHVSTFRWAILALVVVATMINYVDRQLIALLKPLLEKEFGWSNLDYAHIVSAFQLSTALAYLGAGWAIDRLGLRWGYALAVGAWSLAGMAHAAATTVAGFVGARIALGVAEAGNTPAAVKAIAAWFPLRQRSLALGVMNGGANLGAIATPLLVPLLVAVGGWQGAFLLTGGAGLVWMAVWLTIRRLPPEAPTAAAASARTGASAAAAPAESSRPPEPSAPIEAKVPLRQLLRERRTWAFATAKGLTDAVWWFFLFWLPDLLSRNYGLDLKTFGPPLATVYLLACVGAVAGGWLPGWLMQRGWSLNAARKTAMLIAAVAILPVPFALGLRDYWDVILVIGVALAAHQCFSTNLFALAQDLFPKSVVGTVVGLGATCGSFAGLIMLEATGAVLEATGSYLPMFVYAAGAYATGLLIVQLLVPRIVAADDAPRGPVAAH
jgi:ACS family hexuronate transporter-like MFS transporter